MQSSCICSFRNMLRRRGYKDVHIKRLYFCTDTRQYVYLVSFIEPVLGFGLSGEMTYNEIYNNCFKYTHQ